MGAPVCMCVCVLVFSAFYCVFVIYFTAVFSFSFEFTLDCILFYFNFQHVFTGKKVHWAPCRAPPSNWIPPPPAPPSPPPFARQSPLNLCKGLRSCNCNSDWEAETGFSFWLFIVFCLSENPTTKDIVRITKCICVRVTVCVCVTVCICVCVQFPSTTLPCLGCFWESCCFRIVSWPLCRICRRCCKQVFREGELSSSFSMPLPFPVFSIIFWHYAIWGRCASLAFNVNVRPPPTGCPSHCSPLSHQLTLPLANSLTLSLSITLPLSLSFSLPPSLLLPVNLHQKIHTNLIFTDS